MKGITVVLPGVASGPCLLHGALLPQGKLLRDELRACGVGFPAPSAHSLDNKRAERPTLATSRHMSTDLRILRLACQFSRAHLRQISRWLQTTVVLGVPVGSNDFIAKHVCPKLPHPVKRVGLLNSVIANFFLLQACFGACCCRCFSSSICCAR